MARTMTTILKSYLDKAIGNGGATRVLALINSTHTAFDGPTRNILAHVVDGIGEATAFEACMATNNITPPISYATMLRLEHELGGRGNAEELLLCIIDGTIT